MTDTLLEFLPDSGPAQQLMVLLHGVGATPQDLLPLARALRAHFPQAAIVVPAGFEPFDSAPNGRQWFSIRGVTEDNRPQRVAAALPRLNAWVREQQQRLGVSSEATALFGFSQGAIMALEAVHADAALAGRVLAFSGRYARLPDAAAPETTIHLFHGSADPVIAVQHAEQAVERLAGLEGGDATVDIASGVGHELHTALIDSALLRLTRHVPLRLWRTAMSTPDA
jgi:phospholipase/carboxylesterase